MIARIAAVAAGVLLAAGPAAPASATAAPAGAVEWSARHQTAAAQGERWTEPSGMILYRDLVVSGTLSNTGAGCYSVWVRFTFDLLPTPARKQAEICGTGTVDVGLRQLYQYTTTGSLTVCRGTQTTEDCAPWQSITSWPVNRV